MWNALPSGGHSSPQMMPPESFSPSSLSNTGAFGFQASKSDFPLGDVQGGHRNHFFFSATTSWLFLGQVEAPMAGQLARPGQPARSLLPFGTMLRDRGSARLETLRGVFFAWGPGPQTSEKWSQPTLEVVPEKQNTHTHTHTHNSTARTVRTVLRVVFVQSGPQSSSPSFLGHAEWAKGPKVWRDLFGACWDMAIILRGIRNSRCSQGSEAQRVDMGERESRRKPSILGDHHLGVSVRRVPLG